MAFIALTFAIEFPRADGTSAWLETSLGSTASNRISEAAAYLLGYMDQLILPIGDEILLNPDYLGQVEIPIRIENNWYIILFDVIEDHPLACLAALGTHFLQQTDIIINRSRGTFAVPGGLELPLVGHNPVITNPVLTWEELFLLRQHESLSPYQLEILNDHEDSHEFPLLGWEVQQNDPVLPAPDEWEILQGHALADQAFMPED